MSGIVTAGILLSLAPSASAADYAHAVVIIADDLGTDKVGAYAGDVSNPTETRPETPTIDLLAGAGVRFTDAWGMPVCSPTRAALYSGTYAYRNGVGDAVRDASSPALATTVVSIQALAGDAGMQTGLFGKWHVGVTSSTPRIPRARFDAAEYPINTGFGTFRGSSGGEPNSYTSWLYLSSEPDSSMSSGYATAAETLTVDATSRTTDDALDWMQTQVDAGERTLTFVSYNLPHETLNSARTGRSWADAAEACGVASSGDDTTDQRVAVECFDDALAELINGLPDPANTLVIFLGDNGTPTRVTEGNFDDSRGKGSVYESGVRVPLVVADGQAVADALANGGTLPSGGSYAIDAGTEVSDAVALVDVYATLVDLLDLDPGTCTPGSDCAQDSVSLAPTLVGEPSEREGVWTEMFSTSSGVVTGVGAVRIGDFKLVVKTARTVGPCRQYEMYDLSTDRWETTDIFEDSTYFAERAALLEALEGHADAMAGGSSDWLGYDDCCVDDEYWYDGRDADCDGASDYDQDGDGVDAIDYGGSDCDDLDASILPGATDLMYDGLDADCDGANEFDLDGDGFDSADFGGDDCDDFDPSIYPGSLDPFYDGVDGDCDGLSDYDADRDGYDDADFGGDDCDDLDAAIHPGMRDRFYDGIDSDCAGNSDYDADRDGYDSSTYGGDDCNDAHAAIHPGMRDPFYDGVDSDCAGNSDYDADRDGYDSSDYGGTDCNDRRYAIHPGATDSAYDGVDANCDGSPT